MILWALDALHAVDPEKVVVVLGPEGDEVKPSLPAGMQTALQEVRDGTGGATRIGLEALDPAVDTVVVMCGDTPLVDPALVDALISDHVHSGRAATMVTAILPDGGAYGRVVRDPIPLRTPKGMNAFVFNTRRPVFADVRVREALGLLFDFDWVNRNLFGSVYRRTTSFFEGSDLAASGLPASAGERALLARFPAPTTGRTSRTSGICSR
jgi:hypothetical protein